MIVDEFLSRLNKVRSTGGNRWVACCPAHDDRSPSLTVSEGDDGRVLVHCFGGCAVENVVAAVGLTLSDIMPENAPQAHHVKRMRIPAPDVLRAIAFHAKVVAIAACDVGRGVVLSEEDKNKLLEISGEIDEAISYAIS